MHRRFIISIILNILKAENIFKTYNNTMIDRIHAEEKKSVLNGISIQVDEGECIGIMGKSGCGKTTLLKILGTVELATEGTVYYNNVDIKNHNDTKLSELRRRKIGFVFQDYNLLESLTVEENIMLPMILEKKDKKHMKCISSENAEFLGLSNIMKKYPYEISGGEKQRVSIARALSNNPDVIFADEPTGNLDSAAALSIMQYLLKVNKEQNKAVVIVTHDPLMASYCNKLIFLKDGQIVDKMSEGQIQEHKYEKILSKMISL